MKTYFSYTLILSFFLVGCNSVQKLQRQEEIRAKVLELAEKDLNYKMPENATYWAGVKATDFVNGEEIKTGERVFSYQRKDARAWQNRIHWVEVALEMKSKSRSKLFHFKYLYRETGPWTIKLKFEFIYGFPNDDFIHDKDPFAKFRSNRRAMRALQQRKPYVGMAEEAVYLAVGKPHTVEAVTSLGIEEKKLIYEGKIIELRNGRVVTLRYN